MSKMFVAPKTPVKTKKIRGHDLLDEEIINVIKINSSYNNVTLGCTMKLKRNNYRTKPYSITERHRTKSENSEFNFTECFSPSELFILSIQSELNHVDICAEKHHIKKSKSLEDLRIQNESSVQNSHEMEFVSSKIKQMKVNDFQN
ncbi:uncharacterized protein LOC113378105 [Ctenocephalides felis]|uniref:uncharacterized protein LOC113378105 n=1 Tax=Ctenocephalides felis TaxID=7515 RepID=UPI000E6E195E|nr:uncharacterized protein LOC113378105 [Ctenocephalides felis]